MQRWWALVKETASMWVDHKAARLGAALAHYSIFSLGPLLVIASAIPASMSRSSSAKICDRKKLARHENRRVARFILRDLFD